MSRTTGKKNKQKNLRDKPRRRGHDRPPANINLLGTVVEAPRQWIERHIHKVAKSVAQTGEYFDLKTAAQRVARATYLIVLQNSDWGPASDWSPVTCAIIKKNCRPLELETNTKGDEIAFLDVPFFTEKKFATVRQIFQTELQAILSGNYLGPLQREIHLILCVEILNWVIKHPVTPPGFGNAEEELEKPT